MHVWLALLSVGCHTEAPSDTGVGLDHERSDATPADPEAAAKYLALFDARVVQQVDITLPAESLAALQADPFTYVPGDVTINGDFVSSVGIRLKGSSSFQTFDGKPAFKIDFDHFEDGQSYAMLERLTLNNMVGDPSQSREMIGYALWRSAGLVVPHTSYARVSVNGELYGLYLNIEAMDDHLLAREYDDPDGDLWEGNDSSDFTTTGVAHFDLQSGDGDTGALEAAQAVLAGSGPDDFLARADTVLDMDNFLDFWAYSIAIGNQDGYPYHLNDYFVYGDPADDRFDFSPWGMDESWDTAMNWSWTVGTIAQQCKLDPDCLAALYQHTVDALAVYEAEDPSAYALGVWDLSESLVDDDPRCPYTPAQVTAARSELYARLQAWPDRVRLQMGLPPG
jgi:spore coat protein CotH